MRSIKFESKYVKMPPNMESGDIVRLLEVLDTRFEDLHASFVEYDILKTDGSIYPLPIEGDALLLIFMGDSIMFDRGEIFTTVRSNTKSKRKYYRAMRGEFMRVEIVENE